MNRCWDDGELRRPDQHHRPCAFAEIALRQFSQKLGMARITKAGTIEEFLGDRIGDDGRSLAGADEAHASFN